MHHAHSERVGPAIVDSLDTCDLATNQMVTGRQPVTCCRAASGPRSLALPAVRVGLPSKILPSVLLAVQ
jgi:hypothetical protein